MMYIKPKYTEYTNPKFSASYDPKFDVLRLSNSNHDGYSFEELTDYITLVISDDTEQVVGLEIYDLSTVDDVSHTLNENGYKFIAKAYKEIINHLHKNGIVD